MKYNLFNTLVSEVCRLFQIDEFELFKKDKHQEIVDARYLLYYVCSVKNMKLVYIQKYMKKRGYSIPHSTIHYGIKKTKQRIEDDNSFQRVIDRLDDVCVD